MNISRLLGHCKTSHWSLHLSAWSSLMMARLSSTIVTNAAKQNAQRKLFISMEHWRVLRCHWQELCWKEGWLILLNSWNLIMLKMGNLFKLKIKTFFFNYTLRYPYISLKSVCFWLPSITLVWYQWLKIRHSSLSNSFKTGLSEAFPECNSNMLEIWVGNYVFPLQQSELTPILYPREKKE